MRLSFLPGGLLLEQVGKDYVVTIEGEEAFRGAEKPALKKFNAIRTDMEHRYPARELTKEQKQEALIRLVGDFVQRSVRNEQRNSKFGNPKQRRFDNR